MKTINFIRALITIMLVGAVFSMNTYARNPNKDTKYPYYAKQIKHVLEQNVKFPDCGMTISGQGIAEVVFSIKDDGKIEIDEITASCKDLEVYVKKQLAELTITKINHPAGQHYRVTFIFVNG